MLKEDVLDVPTPCRTSDESLLLYSRTGDLEATKELLKEWTENQNISLNINCRGEL